MKRTLPRAVVLPMVLAIVLALVLPPPAARATVDVAQNDTISLMGGFPHFINLAYDRRQNENWSWGVALGGFALNRDLKNGDSARLGISNFNLRARWHPLEGSFFLGLILGTQKLRGEGTQTFDVSGTEVPATVWMDITSGYATPHLGWMWKVDRSLTFGLEMGVQVPNKSVSELDMKIEDPDLESFQTQLRSVPAFKNFENNIEDLASKIGLIALPYVTARVGWSF